MDICISKHKKSWFFLVSIMSWKLIDIFSSLLQLFYNCTLTIWTCEGKRIFVLCFTRKGNRTSDSLKITQQVTNLGKTNFRNYERLLFTYNCNETYYLFTIIGLLFSHCPIFFRHWSLAWPRDLLCLNHEIWTTLVKLAG